MKKFIGFFLFFTLVSLPVFSQFKQSIDTKKKPWTKEIVNIGDNYRFVVLADRTGGGNYEVFSKAIDEVNRLSPDFVICVGDLIDGYVPDSSLAHSQWRELLSYVNRLDMPMFFVGGNHDLSSELMTSIYKEWFGKTYYSFSVGKDLFLVLDTEGHNGQLIDNDQIEYFRNVLDGWNGRWIYVFMHRPLWYPKNSSGYEEIDKLLQNHKYTVFSGHEHLYYMEKRNGMEYYTLATTGGVSDLRGKYLGEYDHYMFVSTSNAEPKIANIRVGSMVPNDIVNKTTRTKVNTLFYGNNIGIDKVLCDSNIVNSFVYNVRINNPDKDSLFVNSAMPFSDKFSIIPDRICAVIPPSFKETYQFKVTPANGNVSQVKSQDIIFRMGYKFDGELVETEIKKQLLIDYKRTVGNNENILIECDKPDAFKESWDWHGCRDGSFKILVSRCDKRIKIKVITNDDLLLKDVSKPCDKVEVFLSNASNENFQKYSKWTFTPDGKACVDNKCNIKSAYKCSLEGNSIVSEIVIPENQFKQKCFMLNVAFTDCDSVNNTKPSILWWKPTWFDKTFDKEFGLFKID